jgi:2-polyprenyl-6-methoxyphenol hydroxylase-like FAD-dependent oxidoreductase
MRADLDALVIGAGPAGSAAAIGLGQAGWRVRIVEQHAFPRRKVCGESLSAAGIELLDALGVGAAWRAAAGPELDRVGWMSRDAQVIAPFPSCAQGRYRVGRALGRERLDALLLERARALGATIEQPARIRAVTGRPGLYRCLLESAGGHREWIATRVVIAAHGSWGPEPDFGSPGTGRGAPERPGDLFAFKANFRDADPGRGVLSVIAFAGGYGGIVEADDGRTTLACCIRRDALAECRREFPGIGAGPAVESALRRECGGLRRALARARREGPWLAVGPIRPGVRVAEPLARGLAGVFRVGNAAGESHPLIGEGITMALHAAALLSRRLAGEPPGMIDEARARAMQEGYALDWREAFSTRLRVAAAYSQLAMRPLLAGPAGAALRLWPGLLTEAARLADKARPAGLPPPLHEEPA